MEPSNLPPGVTEGMIPGNRPEDADWDAVIDWIGLVIPTADELREIALAYAVKKKIPFKAEEIPHLHSDDDRRLEETMLREGREHPLPKARMRRLLKKISDRMGLTIDVDAIIRKREEEK